MAGWKLYAGNRVEVLFERLAQSLSSPPASPWRPEIILVQSRGMERWLTLRLARTFGVWANARFPFPNAFVKDLVSDLLALEAPARAYHPDVMTWRIAGLIRDLGEPEFGSLRTYLGVDSTPMKRFQIASRIADVFDQYLFYRPDLIELWERGGEQHWQARLWRRVVAGEQGLHRAQVRRRLLSLLDGGDFDRELLPQRISLFGISVLPPFHLEILDFLARIIPVNVFLMNPCREFWFDILPDRAIARKSVKHDRLYDSEQLHLVRENGLLASMGAAGGEFFKLILDFDVEQVEEFEEPDGGTLLAAVQSDILGLRPAGGEESAPRLDGSDRSIQVHCCHTPMREVEVLLDGVLRLLEEDPSLQPEDVLVMAPNIEHYAALVHAIFGNAGIRFNLSDRSLVGVSPLVEAFFLLLSLSSERFRVRSVLDLLESEPVRRRLGVREEELGRIKEWIRDTRVRWGIDDVHRRDLGLPAEKQNTWKRGMSRLLLGYALAGDVLFGELLAYEGIEGKVTETLEAFAPFMEELFSFGHAVRESRSLGGWRGLLSRAVSEFFRVDPADDSEMRQLRSAIDELEEMELLSGFGEEIPLEVVRSWLRRRLEREVSSSGFLAGGITFCSMLPMRAIPFDVICLLGMNDGAYPRILPAMDFDLIARNPRLGDRSRRDDDRYLFLETLLSARKVLSISYVGQSVQDNSPIPPSVLVSELLDYVKEGFTAEDGSSPIPRLVTRHRLHGFHPAYFQEGGPRISYSEEHYRISRKLLHPEAGGKSFAAEELNEADESLRIVDLEDLVWFLRNPVAMLCRKRLGLVLRRPEEDSDEREPFTLVGLDRYDLARELVERLREGVSPAELFPRIRAAGVLPHGRMGELEFRELVAESEEFAARLAGQEAGEELPPVELDVEVADFRLRGVIPCRRNVLLRYRCGKTKTTDILSLWVYHLGLNCRPEPGYPRRSLFVGRDRIVSFRPSPDAGFVLAGLLRLYWQALHRAVRFFPASSMAYAEEFARNGSSEKALAKAYRKWRDERPPEAEDPYYRRFFREAPLDGEFEETAKRILQPLLDCREDGR